MSPEMKPATRLVLRQDKNNETGIAFALSRNITWLLHIDIDEIFYEDGDRSWQYQENVGQYRFDNHESVPLSHICLQFLQREHIILGQWSRRVSWLTRMVKALYDCHKV